MNFRNLFHKCSFACAVLLSIFMTSCNGMWDEEGQDCTTYKRIRFTYDWNMLFADAFPHEVKTLTLYAFSPDGTLVYQRKANTDSIIAKGYMDVSDMPSGNYRLQVWAEGEQRHTDSYIFGQPNSGTDAQKGLTAQVNLLTDNNNPASKSTDINHDITPLYYGTLSDADFTDMPLGGVREATVNLMKDTELFRIVLQNENGETLNPADFHFAITDDNWSMDADNNVLATGDTVTYHPWSVTNGETGIQGEDSTVITSLSAVLAEFTTNRLIQGHNMRLHVTRVKDGHEIINIPLIQTCLLVKGNYNRSMSNQEYLDRQDTWNLIFFIDKNRNWLSASIYVESWRVVLQRTDL